MINYLKFGILHVFTPIAGNRFLFIIFTRRLQSSGIKMSAWDYEKLDHIHWIRINWVNYDVEALHLKKKKNLSPFF